MNDKGLSVKKDDLKKSFKQDNDEQKILNAQGQADISSTIIIDDSEALDIFYKEEITDKTTPVPKKKRGRPKGSKNINRKAVKSQKLTISLSEDEVLQLKKHAEKEQRSVSSLIRVALTKQELLKKAKNKY